MVVLALDLLLGLIGVNKRATFRGENDTDNDENGIGRMLFRLTGSDGGGGKGVGCGEPLFLFKRRLGKFGRLEKLKIEVRGAGEEEDVFGGKMALKDNIEVVGERCKVAEEAGADMEYSSLFTGIEGEAGESTTVTSSSSSSTATETGAVRSDSSQS